MKLLVVLGSGGLTAQMLRLVELLGDGNEYEFVINDNDLLSANKAKGKIYKLKNNRIYGESKLVHVCKTIVDFVKSFKIVRDSKANAVVSAGSGITFPLFIAAKLLGKKTVFVTTWCSVNQPSMASRMCYWFSDLFFVQWPELKAYYPKAIYAGRLA
jgi:beta-1,4-N-acetylglucosaminyltransferase